MSPVMDASRHTCKVSHVLTHTHTRTAHTHTHTYTHTYTELRLEGSIKLNVSFGEFTLFEERVNVGGRFFCFLFSLFLFSLREPRNLTRVFGFQRSSSECDCVWICFMRRERTHKPLDDHFNDNDRKQQFICWGFIMQLTNAANEPTQDPLMQMGR